MVKNSGYIGENVVRMLKNGAIPPIDRNHIPPFTKLLMGLIRMGKTCGKMKKSYLRPCYFFLNPNCPHFPL